MYQETKPVLVRWRPCCDDIFTRSLESYAGGKWRAISDHELRQIEQLQIPVIMNPSRRTLRKEGVPS